MNFGCLTPERAERLLAKLRMTSPMPVRATRELIARFFT